MAKSIKKRRVYPAESDPRQAVPTEESLLRSGTALETAILWHFSAPWTRCELASEFGPWVRGADGRWERDRRKR